MSACSTASTVNRSANGMSLRTAARRKVPEPHDGSNIPQPRRSSLGSPARLIEVSHQSSSRICSHMASASQSGV